MMWRFFFTESITVINAVFGGVLVNMTHWVYKFCNKAILFTTPWGVYLAHTRNAWMITQPGYEEEIRVVIDANIASFQSKRTKYLSILGVMSAAM